MIYLFTGLPGHGKTLNAIKYVCENFKDRPVYHNGINGLELDWQECDPKKWFELETGAVIVIDECQRVFPNRKQGAAVPDYVEQLETNRHSGHDLIIITQHPKLMDLHVRRLVDVHRHLLRQFGTNMITQYERTGVFEPTSDNDKAKCIKKTLKLDKKYFDKYKSAEVHTVKTRVPWKIFLPVVFLGLFVATMFYFLNSKSAEAQPNEKAGDDSVTQVARSGSPFGAGKEPMTVTEYTAQLQPRIEGLAFTAPAYDELRKPQQYPWPQCVSSKLRGCKCYTQQGSRLDTSQALCHAIIERGLYDNARPPQNDSEAKTTSEDLLAVHLRASEIYSSIREERKAVLDGGHK